jgi:hypothetical protein
MENKTSTFLGDVILKQIGTSVNVELQHNLMYYSKEHRLILIAKKGFISDLGSIPMFLRGIVRADNIKYSRSFIMHDLLYRNLYDRKTSDLILDEMLKLQQLGWVSRQKIYTGLRLFGSPTNDDTLIENAHKYSAIIDYNKMKSAVDIKDEADYITDILNSDNFSMFLSKIKEACKMGGQSVICIEDPILTQGILQY